MKRLAIVGTNGIPARYGGFETLAENLVRGLASRWDITVYCSGVPPAQRRSEYLGARLIHVPLRANGWQSLPYDLLTTWHAMATADVLLMLGPGVGFALPANLLARRRLVVNHGGLDEWTREKFPWFQRQVLLWSSRFASRWATTNIADNSLLRDSLKRNFGASAEVVRYGGDHVKPPAGRQADLDAKHPFVGTSYHLAVARAQPDNNIHLLIDAYERMPDQQLVVVSNWNVSAYGRELFETRSKLANVRLLPAIYDPRELDYLRANAAVYVHTHSRCGTAPSLVEAMFLGLPTICFDVPTNRETTQGQALYFDSVDALIAMIDGTDAAAFAALGQRMGTIARANYRWQAIWDQYDAILSAACRR